MGAPRQRPHGAPAPPLPPLPHAAVARQGVGRLAGWLGARAGVVGAGRSKRTRGGNRFERQRRVVADRVAPWRCPGRRWGMHGVEAGVSSTPRQSSSSLSRHRCSTRPHLTPTPPLSIAQPTTTQHWLLPTLPAALHIASPCMFSLDVLSCTAVTVAELPRGVRPAGR